MALKVLSALDTARTQFYHFKATIVAGMGLFSDAYSLFCIPPITNMLGHIYYPDPTRTQTHLLPTNISLAMIGIPLLGTAVGQLIFGYLGDRMGRRSVYGLALLIMVASSLACGFSVCTTRGCVLGSLAFFRFTLGLGIGGDYPLSATIMSEFANKNTRGAFIAGVFSMQGFGILASSMVTVVVCKIFAVASGGELSKVHTPAGADVAWRVILMLGAVPSALTYYWRMLMPETARYTALVENNVMQAARDMEKILDLPLSQIQEDELLDDQLPPPNTNTTTLIMSSPEYPSSTFPLFSTRFLRRYGTELFSCAATWFLLDVAFYSGNLFQSQIYQQYLNLENDDVYQEAIKVAGLQALIAICATIPGYYFTVFFIDRVGRRKIQLMGFTVMGFLYLGLGIPYFYWRKHKHAGFMILYGLTFFFANFGPNTTTFIVPAELFPARFRSTCHGISGATGKIGAVVGAVGIQRAWGSGGDYNEGDPDKKLKPMRGALVVLGAVCFLGTVVTYAFTPETMRRSLEENEKEKETETDVPITAQ